MKSLITWFFSLWKKVPDEVKKKIVEATLLAVANFARGFYEQVKSRNEDAKVADKSTNKEGQSHGNA